MLAYPPASTDPSWQFDSGGSGHITSNINNLYVHSNYNGEDQIQVGNSELLSISYVGNGILTSQNKSFHLKNVLHVPKIIRTCLVCLNLYMIIMFPYNLT